MNEVNTMAALREAASRIEGYRAAHNMSFGKLRKRYRGVGSDRQYNRILSGEMPEGSASRWLSEYQAVVRLITRDEATTTTQEPLYDDLTLAASAGIAVREAMETEGLRRLVIVQAPSGQGKSTIAHLLSEQFGSRVVAMDCNETHKGSVSAFLGSLLTALGGTADSAGAAKTLARVVDKLRESRRMVILDEGHHLGPSTLNILKTLINETPGEFVLLTIPTLWRKLERETAYEECRQLTGNRMVERVLYSTLLDSDADTYLRRSFGWDTATAKPVVKAIASLPPDLRTLSCLALMARHARQLGEPVTPEHFESASASIASTR